MPEIRTSYLDWDEQNEDHIWARHRVRIVEVEQAIEGRLHRYRRRGRFIVLGRTGPGRFLMIVLRNVGGNRWRVITARDMDEKERRLVTGFPPRRQRL